MDAAPSREVICASIRARARRNEEYKLEAKHDIRSIASADRIQESNEYRSIVVLGQFDLARIEVITEIIHLEADPGGALTEPLNRDIAEHPEIQRDYAREAAEERVTGNIITRIEEAIWEAGMNVQAGGKLETSRQPDLAPGQEPIRVIGPREAVTIGIYDRALKGPRQRRESVEIAVG